MFSSLRHRTLSAGGLALALIATVTLGSVRCARTQCTINSDCGSRRFCTPEGFCNAECAEDRDCTDGYCDFNGRCLKGPRPDAGPEPDAPVEEASVDTGTPPVDTGFPPVDNGSPPVDAGFPPVDVGFDLGPPPFDNPPPVDNGFPPIDNGFPPVDLGQPVTDRGQPPTDFGQPPADTGRRVGYLEPCQVPTDCESADCAPGNGGARFCTRSCARRSDCGEGMLCALAPNTSTGRCLHDDTGTPCNPTTAVPCRRFCYTTSGSTVAHCTRECTAGADCPAGFACQSAGVGQPRVCVEIERPCRSRTECATLVCLAGLNGTAFAGCSSTCTSASDCPRRPTVIVDGRPFQLPPYTCQRVDGLNICVPPLEILGGDIAGSDSLGTTCSITGVPRCYSGLCYSDDMMPPPVCIQGCTPSGGCPAGYGCKPVVEGTDPPMYLCRPAGNGYEGSPCTRGSDCATALCQDDGSGTRGYCTRLCVGTVACPAGMRCAEAGRAVDGQPVRLCVR